jgi:pyridoxal phosphate enzyme (YggS family)
VSIAERLERAAIELSRRISVLVQVDLAGESTKSGATDSELNEIAAFLKDCRNISFDGLMVLPPYFEDPEDVRPFFRRLKELRDGLREAGFFPAGSGELSMGMSHDFEVAIEEGATIVRVGTALFGARET